jgi:2-polyprenyl-3-methyl-5-hydroxy-6-metoxy-1,4-benzoquinol methylase
MNDASTPGVTRHPDTNGRDTGVHEIRYERVTYEKYDSSNCHDEAKKTLEKHLVASTLEALCITSGTSLDIGCATGRYPLWFAENGYDAVGFDIDPHSIRICQQKSDGIHNAKFERRNLLEGTLPEQRFNVVTCMMGTLNHIPLGRQPLFFRRVFEVMEDQSAFLVSSWNPRSYYVELLDFYPRAEREQLLANARPAAEMRSLLMASGFRDVEIIPFGLLPNDCYFAWELPPDALSTMEDHLRSNWPALGDDAQLYLAVGQA